jgi:hypothetical protein
MLYSVIETLCEHFVLEITGSEMYLRVLTIAFHLFEFCFDPSDPSRYEFYEYIIRILSFRTRSNVVLPIVWKMCNQIGDSNKGRYAILYAIKASAEQSAGFWDDKVVIVIQLLLECLSSDLEILRDGAIETIIELGPMFSRNAAPKMNSLIHRLITIIQTTPSQNSLSALRVLLEAVPDKSSFPEGIIPVLLTMVSSPMAFSGPDLVECVGVAIEKSDGIVQKYVPDLIVLMRHCLEEHREEYQWLQVAGFSICERLVKLKVGWEISEGTHFYHFINRHIHSDNASIAHAALSLFRTVLEQNTLEGRIRLDLIDFAFLMELVGEDWDQKFLESWSVGLNDGVPYILRFQCAANSLLILSRLVTLNETVFREHSNEVIMVCRMQTRSVCEICTDAACQALAVLLSAAEQFNCVNESLLSEVLMDLGTIAGDPSCARPVMRKLLFELQVRPADPVEFCARILGGNVDCSGHHRMEDFQIISGLLRVMAKEDSERCLSIGKDCYEGYLAPKDDSAEIGLLFPMIYLGYCIGVPCDEEVKSKALFLLLKEAEQKLFALDSILVLVMLAKDLVHFDEYTKNEISRLLSMILVTDSLPIVSGYALIGLMTLLMNSEASWFDAHYRSSISERIFGMLPLGPEFVGGAEVSSSFTERFFSPDDFNMKWPEHECEIIAE